MSTGSTPNAALPTSQLSSPTTLTQEEVEKCRTDLIQHYDEVLSDISTDIFNPNSQVAFDDIYTQLYLLKEEPKEGGDNSTDSPKRHGFSSIFDFLGLDVKNVKKEELSDEEFYGLITPGKPPYRILIAGEAGVGKTTFLAKLTNDWKAGKCFKEVKLLFRIPLREAETSKVFGDIVQKYLSDVNLYGLRLDEYIRTNQRKVMLLLDGLDEFDGDITAETDDNVLSQIMGGDKFKECVVIIATRPWRADKISNIDRFQKKFTFVSIEGFSKEHQKLYTDKFFRNFPVKAQSIRRFLEEDAQNDGVFSKIMAPYPIYMAMLCHMWQDDTVREQVETLQTVSQLLNLMGDTLKVHYARKTHKDKEGERYEDRLQHASKCFTEVGNTVYPHDPNTYQRRLVFNKDALAGDAQSFETACDVGIVTREKKLAPVHVRRGQGNLHEIEYRINHMLLLDFLAAKYLASVHLNIPVFETHLEELISASKDDIDKFEYLWYFTVAQGKNIARTVLDILKQEVDNTDFIIRVAFECHDKEVAAPVTRTRLGRALRLKEKRSLNAHVFALDACTSLVSAIFKTDANTKIM